MSGEQTMNENAKNFDDWIPWYVNGTLNAADREAMERYLAANATARDEVALFEKTAHEMRQSAQRIPNDIGLANTLARIRREKQDNANVTAFSERKTTVSSFSWRSWMAGNWMKPALVAALTVIGIQSALLLRMSPVMRGESPSTDTRTVTTNASLLRVRFSPSATEAEVRVLLSSVSARMYDGPAEDGSYLLQVADRDAIRALEALRASRAVSSANGTLDR
jgi:anti-sigma factor RsiW